MFLFLNFFQWSTKALTEILINNLLLNAIRHNKENGKMILRLQAHTLQILNTGVDTPLDSQTIFRRFKKNSTDARSSGLGLAIAKEICDRHNWRIQYQHIAPLHTFMVQFQPM